MNIKKKIPSIECRDIFFIAMPFFFIVVSNRRQFFGNRRNVEWFYTDRRCWTFRSIWATSHVNATGTFFFYINRTLFWFCPTNFLLLMSFVKKENIVILLYSLKVGHMIPLRGIILPIGRIMNQVHNQLKLIEPCFSKRVLGAVLKKE